ncbi:ATP-dependent 6-phosphofructokinase [Planctomicrobium piriforme]|uniref:ATP-dependent 6-phosphofructokinase n=1 Tax=Planctomicrobium piriforme TaxID=1576369 RepID=A0A1I3HF71_9PLAN|nr:ATP-dependent 6-phosphofructokinase [Planctomicrobium piriforme]SFI34313.1 6-phosphofructokinase 1 [Planctomicrobium piriforme]
MTINTLGPCLLDSPLAPELEHRRHSVHYVHENDRVLFDDTVQMLVDRGANLADLPGFEPAGPRRKIFFEPASTGVGIVTCGGLCPGLNDVVRGLVMELWFHYGVRRIYGFRNGYQGLVGAHTEEAIELKPRSVRGINEDGGTMLGTSRGKQDPSAITDTLQRMNIQILFVVGGDGTLRGASTIAQEIAKRDLKISVVGVPKTIDNDIPFIDQSFGFQTAFSEATVSIRAAHVEAQASPNGIGLVKLMGRHSGFIACYASLAKNDANYVLIPEVPFQLDGPKGFLAVLRKRIESAGHAVIVAAEGAGQDLIQAASQGADKSGNVKLHDIGLFLKEKISQDFAAAGMELNLKYIDPSYIIRSVPANPYDSVYCVRLAHNAVHAAMAGRTEMVVGRWHGRFVHVPIALAVSQRNQVDPDGDLWLSVLEATGQPRCFG